ncbi:hypothetical protein [Peterkaempfera sp. SMS 1(5)a]|uniref:WXG100 family type VII secretion target n=1 Tax=Peterkaempfera podocarpi TaxID=3232308 RepID=UPI00366E301E
MAEEYTPAARTETIGATTRPAAAQRIGTVSTTLPNAPAASTATGDGSAGSGFQVVPEQYTAAVSPLQSMADQLSEMYTSLNSFLSQFDKPWGDDHAGQQFAEGDTGYIKYSTDVLTVLKNLPDELRNTADGIKFMAENYEGTEQAVVSGLTGQDQDLESTQGDYWSPSGYSYGTETAGTSVSDSGYSSEVSDPVYGTGVAERPVSARYEPAAVGAMPVETPQIPVEPRVSAEHLGTARLEPAAVGAMPVETPQIPVEPRVSAEHLGTARLEPAEVGAMPVETPQIPVEPRVSAEHLGTARLEPAEVEAMPVETPQIPVEPRLSAEHFVSARFEPAAVGAMPVETPQIPVEPRVSAEHLGTARLEPAEVEAMPVETPQIPVEPRLSAEHFVSARFEPIETAAEPGPTDEGR